MKDLSVSIIQSKLQWETPSANLKMLAEKLDTLKNQTDIILLPEMFTTGFSMNAATLAEDMQGRTMEWLATQAAQCNAVIAGSFIVKENNHYYNRFVWMQASGEYEYYDKRHLFTLAKEDETYTAGTKKLILNYKGWKICPLICYDLRFPVWSRNAEGYDLLIYVANFPAKRAMAWKSLLVARAIENQVYTVGVNIVGKDGNGYYYSGDSSIIDYEGQLLFQKADEEAIFTKTLTYKNQANFRKSLHFLADQDRYNIIL